jgi:hypothetical protein
MSEIVNLIEELKNNQTEDESVKQEKYQTIVQKMKKIQDSEKERPNSRHSTAYEINQPQSSQM